MHYVRNVRFDIKEGKSNEFQRVLQTEVLPLLRAQKGFKEELTLVNQNRGMGISIWSDRPSAETYHETAFPKVVDKLNPYIVGSPRVETFDLVVSTLPA